MDRFFTRFYKSLLTVFLSILLASVFGIIHNQISYTIAPSYFTDFKFNQFHMQEYATQAPRFYASLIGVYATWWFGMIIGIVLLIASSLCYPISIMRKQISLALKKVFITTICFTVTGIILGFFNASVLINPLIPETMYRFLLAGTMHNCSYLGGIIGLIYATFMIIKTRDKKSFNPVRANVENDAT